MKYECVILPEDFVNNRFMNITGGEFGCPIDRAMFRAGVPLEGGCYSSTPNVLCQVYSGDENIKDTVVNKVIAMDKGVIPIERIEFTIEA